jgi:hypothetical protein
LFVICFSAEKKKVIIIGITLYNKTRDWSEAENLTTKTCVHLFLRQSSHADLVKMSVGILFKSLFFKKKKKKEKRKENNR